MSKTISIFDPRVRPEYSHLVSIVDLSLKSGNHLSREYRWSKYGEVLLLPHKNLDFDLIKRLLMSMLMDKHNKLLNLIEVVIVGVDEEIKKAKNGSEAFQNQWVSFSIDLIKVYKHMRRILTRPLSNRAAYNVGSTLLLCCVLAQSGCAASSVSLRDDRRSTASMTTCTTIVTVVHIDIVHGLAGNRSTLSYAPDMAQPYPATVRDDAGRMLAPAERHDDHGV